MRIRGPPFFYKRNLYLADNGDWLQKFPTFSNDQGLTNGSPSRVTETTLALKLQTPTTIITMMTVAITIPCMNPKVEWLTTRADDIYIHEPLPSLSPIKRNQGDCPSILVEWGSSKRARLSKEVELEALTPFFRLPTIIPSRVPIICCYGHWRPSFFPKPVSGFS